MRNLDAQVKLITHFLLGYVLFLNTAFAQADFSRCSENFAGNSPPTVHLQIAENARALCFDGFAVLYSPQSKTAVYAAEHITAESLARAKTIKRVDRFYEEARLPFAHRSRLSDYKGSGFDRGHLFPAGNASTPEAMAQSFSLANMVPQNPTNNRGSWAKSVEQAVRKYVERTRGEVYVVTGPVFEQPVRVIGSSKVWVPSKLFKFVYDPRSGKSWGYVLDNNESSRVKGVLSYEEMVRITGIEFLHGGVSRRTEFAVLGSSACVIIAIKASVMGV